MLTQIKEMMSQLSLTPNETDVNRRNELLLLRLYSMLDMKYQGDVSIQLLTDVGDSDEDMDFFNPYKWDAKVKSAFSNVFHTFTSKNINFSLLYGDIDPLTINRNDGIRPSLNSGLLETPEEDFIPRANQKARSATVQTISPDNIPLQLLIPLTLFHGMTNEDFLALCDYVPQNPILPSLLIGLSRRGHSFLLLYIIARYKFLTPSKPWLTVDTHSGHTCLIAAAQRGNIHVLDTLLYERFVYTEQTSEISLYDLVKSVLRACQAFYEYFPEYSDKNGVVCDYITSYHTTIASLCVKSTFPSTLLSDEKLPQTACPGRKEREVNVVDIADEHGFTPLMHAISNGEAYTAAYLIEVVNADYRYVSNGAVVINHMLQAPFMKEVIEEAITKRFQTRVAKRIDYYQRHEYKVDYPF